MARTFPTWLLGVSLGLGLLAGDIRAKDKGLPSSPQRDLFCKGRLDRCYHEVHKNCRDTYDRVDHRADCVNVGNRRCADLYGERSTCRTAPVVGPDLTRPKQEGSGTIVEPPRPRPKLPARSRDSELPR